MRSNPERVPITRRQFLRGAAASAGAFALPGMSLLAGEEKSKPNVVMVMMDTLRADHCSCYGYPKPTTPFMDSVAKEGTRFSQCIASSSWTTPSIMSAFTGFTAPAHGTINMKNVLPDGIPTLAERMKSAGYHTLGVLCNPCAAGKFGFSRGFDLYDDFTILLDFELNIFDIGDKGRRSLHGSPTSRRITDLTLSHLAKVPKDKPLFLFVLYFDPHGDYMPERRYEILFDADYSGEATGKVYGLPNVYRFESERDLEHVVALYDAEIRQADDEVARLVKELEARGFLSDEDLLIYTADHGEEFCEHGGLKHGRTLFDEVVRVPLVMRWPGRMPKGKEVPNLVELRDLAPTLSRIAGAKSLGQSPERDLYRLAKGDAKPSAPVVGLHVSATDEQVGLRTDEWTLVRDPDNGVIAAYDLRNDPEQRKRVNVEDLPDSAPSVSDLDAWLQGQEALLARYSPKGSKKADLTAQQVRALKAMGYIH